MKPRIFIDGDAGTTGLQIRARLGRRNDVELLRLPEAQRKDPDQRARALNAADLAILCLPDAAAREAVRLIERADVRVIDASTAHRTDPGWVYGLPEIGAEHARRVAAATRVANPGCYPTGAVSLVRPLVEAGLVPPDFPATVNAVSGYSGGGRKLIERFESADAPDAAESWYYVYALGLEHKHVEEMRVHGLLRHRPLFVPSVGRFRQGMLVQVPLQLWALPARPALADVHAVLAGHYRGQPFVEVPELAEAASLDQLDPESLNGTNVMRLYVFGNERHGQALLAAVLDNLGKGAAGAAVQSMNLMLGLEPAAGLTERLAA